MAKKNSTPKGEAHEVIVLKPTDEVLKGPAEVIPVAQQFVDKGIAHKKANAHVATFVPYLNQLGSFEADIDGINADSPTADDAALARAIRLKLVKVRTGAGDAKALSKRDILVEGELIDGLYKVVESSCKLKESYLLEIEKHQERQAQAAKDSLRDKRVELLQAVGVDTEFISAVVADMPDDSFARMLENETKKFEALKLQESQQAQAEAEGKENEVLFAERVVLLAEIGFFHSPEHDAFLSAYSPGVPIYTNLAKSATGDEFQKILDDERDVYNKAIQKEKDDEQKAADELARYTVRTQQVVALGIQFDGQNWSGPNGLLTTDGDIRYSTDEVWAKQFGDLERKKANNDALIARTKARKHRLYQMGLVYVESTQRHPGVAGFESVDAAISLEKLNKATDATFDEFVRLTQDAKDKRVSEAKKAQDEANKLLETQRKEKEAADALLIAPDKDRLKAVAAELERLVGRLPKDLKTPAMQKVSDGIGTLLTKVITYAKEKTA